MIGRCASLTDATASLSGDSIGTWDPTAGTFVVSLGPMGSCSGGGSGTWGMLTLTFKGCGRVRITVTGDGHDYNGSSPINGASAVVTAGVTVVNLSSPIGSSSDPCATTPLVAAGSGYPSPGEVNVVCGSQLICHYSHLFGGGDHAGVTCTFLIEVL